MIHLKEHKNKFPHPSPQQLALSGLPRPIKLIFTSLLAAIFLPLSILVFSTGIFSRTNFVTLSAASCGAEIDDLRSPLFSADDRILILAPHPDDETLGCGGIIQKAVALHLPIRVVFLTYGDDNEWSFLVYRKLPVIGSQAIKKMGLLRAKEARQATARLGLQPQQITFLGYPDHAMESIWNEHWGNRPPAVGPLSRAHQVPYSDAFRPGAPYKGEDVVEDFVSILREFKPTKIFLSHPADSHPDHRSLYLFVRVAIWEMKDEINLSPKLFPYLVHFPGWPEHKGCHESMALEPPKEMENSIHWLSVPLNPQEEMTKLAALKLHKSQHESAAPFLDAFIRKNELFGDFPELIAEQRPLEAAEQGDKQMMEQRMDERKEKDGSQDNAEPSGPLWLDLDKGKERLVIAFFVPGAELDKPHLSFRLFGYRHDVPFAEMPKLLFRISGETFRVYDKGEKINSVTVEVKKKGARLTVAVPLEALGKPQRIFFGTRAALAPAPALGLKPQAKSFYSWRIIVVRGKNNREIQ